MYKTPKFRKTTIAQNESVEGEPIETKVNRLLTNGEAIGQETDLIYTERKDGVIPLYNIKSDKFEIALDAMDKLSKSEQVRRMERHTKKDGEAETVGGEQAQN